MESTDMAAERPTPTDAIMPGADRRIQTATIPQAASPASQDTTITKLSPLDILARAKHQGTFVDIRGLISPSERRRRREERGQSGAELFSADLLRIDALLAIDSEFRTTRFNEFALPPQTFPDTGELTGAYTKTDENGKRKLKEAARQFTEKALSATLPRVEDDIKVLHTDRGSSVATASDAIDRNLQTVTGRSASFRELKKAEQVAVLQSLMRERSSLLRTNFGHYMGYLTAYAEALGLKDTDLAELKKKYESSDVGEQAKQAADVRIKAVRAMDITRKANTDRLKDMLVISGKPPRVAEKEVEDLRASYRQGGLAQKERTIERIKRRKLELAVPRLGEISRLRQLLEREDFLRRPSVNFDGVEYEDRIAMECEHIETLLSDRVSMGPLDEIGVVDLEREIGKLARLHEDPSLVDIFEVVKLLRTTSY